MLRPCAAAGCHTLGAQLASRGPNAQPRYALGPVLNMAAGMRGAGSRSLVAWCRDYPAVGGNRVQDATCIPCIDCSSCAGLMRGSAECRRSPLSHASIHANSASGSSCPRARAAPGSAPPRGGGWRVARVCQLQQLARRAGTVIARCRQREGRHVHRADITESRCASSLEVVEKRWADRCRVWELSGLQGPGDLVSTEDDARRHRFRAEELE